MAKDTILVADDDRTVVTLVSAFLRKKGFNVVNAFDATHAMLAARQAAPKAIVLDVNMPGGTGVDVLQKLKAMTKTTQIPIVIVTASDKEGLDGEVKDLGAAEFLRKPVDLDQLHEALLRALGRPPETSG